MLRRRNKQAVLAEVPLARGGSTRRGALGRAALDTYSGLSRELAESGVVLLTGTAKSDVALGLAAAATAAGRRVALLEADLAAPALAATLGLSHAPGLHEYLRGEVAAEAVLQPLVLAGPASGAALEPLTCIVAGEPEPAPVALLDSERFDHAIEKLRHAYDLLLIDGPPLSEDVDSLRALSEHAGATLACGERGEIPKRPPISLTGTVLVA